MRTVCHRSVESRAKNRRVVAWLSYTQRPAEEGLTLKLQWREDLGA